jgi:hypothetical protein
MVRGRECSIRRALVDGQHGFREGRCCESRCAESDRPMRGGDIAEKLEITLQRVHQLVIRLHAQGYVSIGDQANILWMVMRAGDKTRLLSRDQERVLSAIPIRWCTIFCTGPAFWLGSTRTTCMARPATGPAAALTLLQPVAVSFPPVPYAPSLSANTAEPEHIGACPLPSHDLRNGHLNQTAYCLFLFIRDLEDDTGDNVDRTAGDVGSPFGLCQP